MPADPAIAEQVSNTWRLPSWMTEKIHFHREDDSSICGIATERVLWFYHRAAIAMDQATNKRLYEQPDHSYSSKQKKWNGYLSLSRMLAQLCEAKVSA